MNRNDVESIASELGLIFKLSSDPTKVPTTETGVVYLFEPKQKPADYKYGDEDAILLFNGKMLEISWVHLTKFAIRVFLTDTSKECAVCMESDNGLSIHGCYQWFVSQLFLAKIISGSCLDYFPAIVSFA